MQRGIYTVKAKPKKRGREPRFLTVDKKNPQFRGASMRNRSISSHQASVDYHVSMNGRSVSRKSDLVAPPVHLQMIESDSMDHPYSRGGRLRSPAEPSFSVRQEAKVDTMQPSPIQIIAQPRETFDPKIYIQPPPVDAGDLPVIHQEEDIN